MAETSEQDRQRDEAGREAIRHLSRPVKGRVMLAQAFTVLSALLSFAPYLALVWLGDLFLAGEGPLAQADASKVHEIALLLAMAFLSQLFFRALALIIMHFADMKLRYVIRRGIVERLSRAPLAWFSATDSGRVRSAVQDDTKMFTPSSRMGRSTASTASCSRWSFWLSCSGSIGAWRSSASPRSPSTSCCRRSP